MRRRLPLVLAGWLVTGVLATGTGVAAITFLGEPLTASAHRPLSSAEVEEALARALPPEAVPSAAAGPADPAPSATGRAEGRSRTITTAGGNVIARCDGGVAVLRTWSPAQGFRVDDVERGPAARARVEFESDEADVKVEVRCGADGLPVHRVHD
ncbi:hypothetical protein [Planomonospora sp. ID82291]|uniref:hypothetical protein n=1 Tax=Planomonospora sp. ID82291 TaxID=2738136 RepID=UPI0018C4499B|nr:hypothetical protein [Planomonospora sp. ID82291]MBG0815963.1 septum formation initiator [Planomonospora sp. ID82291]